MARSSKSTGKVSLVKGSNPNDPKSTKNGKKKQAKKEMKTVPQDSKGGQKVISLKITLPMVHHSVPGTVGKTKVQVPTAQTPVTETAKGTKEVKKALPPKMKLPLVHHSVPGTMGKTKVPMAKPVLSGIAKGTQPTKDIIPSKMTWTDLFKGSHHPAPRPKITQPTKNSIPRNTFKPAVAVSFLPDGGFSFPPLK